MKKRMVGFLEVKGSVLGSWCTYPSLMSGAECQWMESRGVPVPASSSIISTPRKGDDNQRSLRSSRDLVCVIKPLTITTRLGIYLYRPIFTAHG